MSQDRLLLLIRFCRFDDGETRDEHKVNRYGHVCEICDTFHNHCRKLYRIGAYAFGVAFRIGAYAYWILTDAENHYCYNAIPYLG